MQRGWRGNPCRHSKPDTRSYFDSKHQEKETMMILAQTVLPPKALASFGIASALLLMIGTLLLAYDLLGRENGPLRWFTLVITCELVSALILATIGTILFRLFNNAFDLNWTLRFLVLGGFLGFFT